jgi:hypothetical protein
MTPFLEQLSAHQIVHGKYVLNTKRVKRPNLYNEKRPGVWTAANPFMHFLSAWLVMLLVA